jgi:hypothetical protein
VCAERSIGKLKPSIGRSLKTWAAVTIAAESYRTVDLIKRYVLCAQTTETCFDFEMARRLHGNH